MALFDLLSESLCLFGLGRQVSVDVGPMPEDVGDGRVDVRQSEDREGLHDLFGRGARVEGADDDVERDASSRNPDDSLLVRGHRDSSSRSDDLRRTSPASSVWRRQSYWYSRGEISQERAAQVAGLDRTDFSMALAREGVDAFGVDFADLERELTRDWSQADEDAWQREAAITRQNAQKAGIGQGDIDRAVLEERYGG